MGARGLGGRFKRVVAGAGATLTAPALVACLLTKPGDDELLGNPTASFDSGVAPRDGSADRLDATPARAPADAGPGDCYVHSDKRLYCPNDKGAPLYMAASFSSAVVNRLRTSPSYFLCWGTGELHPGGNTTWYYTQGDDTPSYGWIPAVNLRTTPGLDANPSAAGLVHCR